MYTQGTNNIQTSDTLSSSTESDITTGMNSQVTSTEPEETFKKSESDGRGL
jgi:hypothetical protein